MTPKGRIHVIKVPDVGEGIAEVELVAWHVAPGDAIAEDQALADVMTDKASVEIPSPVAGRVLALGGELGQMLAVGSELIRIELADAGAAPAAKAQAPVGGAAAPASKAAGPAPKAVAPARKEAAPAQMAAASAASKPAAQAEKPASQAAAQAAPAASGAPAVERPAIPDTIITRPIASPSVRRRAWELGIDLKEVSASGRSGRILHADLDAAAAGRSAPPAQPGRSAAPAAPAVAPIAARPGSRAEPRDDVQSIPVIGLRRRIAMQMQEAKRHIPHFSYVEEVDVTELEALRAVLNRKWAVARGHLTLLPLLMRALVLALADFPQMNARFDDEKGIVTRHAAVHLGIATQTPHGLLVPVLRQAQALDLWALAAELTRLADLARAGRATRDELSGSTITITSLGALGGIVTTPIINRPEVAIVGVNRIVERAVFRGGAVVPRLTMNLSSSFDHRVIDGADAARFVQAVRALLETPALLFVE